MVVICISTALVGKGMGLWFPGGMVGIIMMAIMVEPAQMQLGLPADQAEKNNN